MKKIIAMYLPQYYAFPENDKWWGEGFTDWENVKKAKPLFKGHMQPKIPLNKNYYCLLDKNIHKWQAELAAKYGIEGFCYYHYWFNGKLLLEKPIELVLNNTDINIKFCLSWANESWARTWDGQEKNYLIKQEYGGKDDWEKHIRYLISFFLDPRYIRIENKPVLLIYTSAKIKQCQEMIDYWNKRVNDYGIDGLYIIETLNSYQKEPVLSNSQGIYYFEPAFTISNDLKKQDILHKVRRFILSKAGIGRVLLYDASKAYKYIENRNDNFGKTVFKGTFTEWDNTPRKSNRGTVMINNSLELFGENLRKLMTERSGGEFVFINAWNEWAEGAYLEPDEENGYSYLHLCRKLGRVP